MRYFKIHLLAILIIYASAYFIYSFIHWELYNPIKWILEIPNYTNEDRASIIVAVVIYHFFSWVFIASHILNQQDNTEENK